MNDRMFLYDVSVRPEEPGDIPAIHRINQEAFGTAAEANLVDLLRLKCKAVLSLVAGMETELVGHILFSRVTIESQSPALRVAGLAPMAVLPRCQKRGVGSVLVRAGLERCRSDGFAGVVVLGHANYYPRFGFQPASRFGLRSEYDVPDEVFMAMEFESGALGRVPNRLVRYESEFATV